MISRKAMASPQRCRSASQGSSSSGCSSANEYAEGLGCADQKACRRHSSSNFEFDNHPREEYFEEPESFCAHSESDDELRQQQSAGDGVTAASGAAMMSALIDLETQEDARSLRTTREEFVRRKLAAISRRADRRLAKRALETESAEAAFDVKARRAHKVTPEDSVCRREAEFLPSRAVAQQASLPFSRPRAVQGATDQLAASRERVLAAAQHEVKKGSNSECPRRLQKACAELVEIRGRMGAAGNMTATDRSRSSEILRYLESVGMDARLLKSSGLGFELNRSAWTRHSLPEFAAQSVALVRKWRAIFRQQRQQQRDAGA